MLVSAFAGSGIVTVHAYGPPGGWPEGQPYFTLHAVAPSFGWPEDYHLYFEILRMIRTELAKIGIKLQVIYYDESGVWEIVWESGWNVSSLEYLPGTNIPGWDLAIQEWWMMPTGLLWLEPLVSSWLTPPEGYNIFPWMNEKADELLWKGMHTLNATERKKYLWAWQELFMHDAPMIYLYYPRLYEVTAVWVEGWDSVVRFQDVSHLAINETLFAEYAPEWRKTEPHTLVYGVSEEVWNLNPLFIHTQTEEWMCDLWFETLYDLSIDPWPPAGQPPAPWKPRNFYSKPALAAEPLIFMEGPNGPNTRARVLLRDNVYWSDGVKFNATDVKFTSDLILDSATKAVANIDFSLVVESVEIVNETCVDFILYEPYADLATLLSDDWGLAIIPYHTLKDILPEHLRVHPSNLAFDDPTQWLPGTGPFIMTEYDPGDHIITLEKNPNYFGYDLGWGPYNITKIVLKCIPDADERLSLLEYYHEIDFLGEYAPAGMMMMNPFWELQKRSDLRVWQYDSPSGDILFFNLNNPYLSNRYVRQAIAHAIPYKHIFEDILWNRGIAVYKPGKALITPLHYYTDENNVTVHLFNEELEPFEYNLAKAQQYLDMWKYSTDTANWALGPVGDADQSGRVDATDWGIWRASQLTGTWPDPDGWIYPTWPFAIDPDWDNDEDADSADKALWGENYGTEYPFPGAK